jgi:hypothetical protein
MRRPSQKSRIASSSFEPRENYGRGPNVPPSKPLGSGYQQKLELIEGELIDKMGKKRPHTNGQTFSSAC